MPNSNGAMRIQSDTYRYAIEHALFLGKNYEVEASIGPAQGISGTSGHGIWLSKRPWSGTHWNSLVYGAYPKGIFSIAAHRWRYTANWRKKFKRKEPHVMNLQCHRELWSVSVDGKKLTDKDIDMGTYNNGDQTRIALGGYVNPVANTTVNYQRVRVRKLEERED